MATATVKWGTSGAFLVISGPPEDDTIVSLCARGIGCPAREEHGLKRLEIRLPEYVGRCTLCTPPCQPYAEWMADSTG
jgi:hypothetical protein